MNDKAQADITIVGAGLVGSLLAIILARKGFSAEIYERRPDMRSHEISAGRSINLAISTRGIEALARLNIDKEILSHAIPMKGRMIHNQSGQDTFQPYGIDDSQFINSISRATLNKVLMNFAEETKQVKIHFNQKVEDIDFTNKTLRLFDEQSGEHKTIKTNIVIGTDGTASAIRQRMETLPGYSFDESALDYGYKELVIPPGKAGSFQLEKNALHIWPRKTFMLIALPNFEGSFTCTLFLPFEGPVSFAELPTANDVKCFFQDEFAHAMPLIENLEETFFANPTGRMVTVKGNKWYVDGSTLLMGDAAHGIVPFFGQGMNCGFEDCTQFSDLLNQSIPKTDGEWTQLFEEFTTLRRPNTDAIADMAVENFVEMRDKVADKDFLMRKGLEKILEKKFPGHYRSRYSLVTFSNLPYRLAYDVGIADEKILKQLCQNLVDPDDVDLEQAHSLIEEHLAPLLSPHAGELQASKH
jgi:kynurenine 3-monooxygenase